MSRTHSLGLGGGSNDSPPRLSPAGDAGSPTAAALKARQRFPDQLGRPSGTQSRGYKRPSRAETLIALDPLRVSEMPWKTAAGSGKPCLRAVCVCHEYMMRIVRDKVACGRPMAVPDRSRRLAETLDGVRDGLSGQPTPDGGTRDGPGRLEEASGCWTTADKPREWRDGACKSW